MTTTHPGAELWADWIRPCELTVGDAAKVLGVSRKTVSAIVNGRQGITADMSVRLSKAFGTEPDTWAAKQLAYDIAHAPSRRLRIKRLLRPTTTTTFTT